MSGIKEYRTNYLREAELEARMGRFIAKIRSFELRY